MTPKELFLILTQIEDPTEFKETLKKYRDSRPDFKQHIGNGYDENKDTEWHFK